MINWLKKHKEKVKRQQIKEANALSLFPDVEPLDWFNQWKHRNDDGHMMIDVRGDYLKYCLGNLEKEQQRKKVRLF